MKFVKLTDIFPVHGVGIVTGRDRFTIKETPLEVYNTLVGFSTMADESARDLFKLGADTRDWVLSKAKKDVRTSGVEWKKIVPVLYRPFDIRFTYYTGRSRGFLCMPRAEVMRHMLQPNIALVTVKSPGQHEFSHCFVSPYLIESRLATVSKGISYVFPRFLYPKTRIRKRKGGLLWDNPHNALRKPNINLEFLRWARKITGVKELMILDEIFYYVYAILFCRVYRKEYRQQLETDFPGIPFFYHAKFFHEMSRLGEQLASVHQMSSTELSGGDFQLKGKGDNLVKKIYYRYSCVDNGRIYINKKQYFSPVPFDLWNYTLCGYPVLKKWLYGHRGSVLRVIDSDYFIKVLRALELTLQYQQRIDILFCQTGKLVPGIKS